MTNEQIKKTVLEALHSIAPDVDLNSVREDADLREQFDIDSMDFLRFVRLLKEQLGVEVPEADYRQIASIQACAEYLQTRLFK